MSALHPQERTGEFENLIVPIWRYLLAPQPPRQELLDGSLNDQVTDLLPVDFLVSVPMVAIYPEEPVPVLTCELAGMSQEVNALTAGLLSAGLLGVFTISTPTCAFA